MTAMSNSLCQTLVRAGAPLGVLEHTERTLRSANGIRIGVSGCSHCVVSFMGLLPVLPVHLRGLLDQTSRDLDVAQQRQLASHRSHWCGGTRDCDC